MKLILASGSPRRKELLAKAGFSFTVRVSHVDENYTETMPGEIVRELSAIKCEAVAHEMEEPCLVLGADTVVAVDREILGKPADEADAVRMIRMIAGRSHQVMTGVTIIRMEKAENGEVRETGRISFYDSTDVHVRTMTEEEILSYVRSGESMDAAGAYKIQEGFGKYIEGFDGDYENVIGLPVKRCIEAIGELDRDTEPEAAHETDR